jgi:hypothetical protein
MSMLQNESENKYFFTLFTFCFLVEYRKASIAMKLKAFYPAHSLSAMLALK